MVRTLLNASHEAKWLIVSGLLALTKMLGMEPNEAEQICGDAAIATKNKNLHSYSPQYATIRSLPSLSKSKFVLIIIATLQLDESRKSKHFRLLNCKTTHKFRVLIARGGRRAARCDDDRMLLSL
jgi:hypothetical protein